MGSTALATASAVGALLGGVGGVAGILAFLDQRRERERQRAAPPPGVRDNVLILRRAASQVVEEPRSREWFADPTFVVAIAELERLQPVVERPTLRLALRTTLAYWTATRSLAAPTNEDPRFPRPPAEVFTQLHRQKETAALCLEEADRAITLIQQS